MSDSEDFESADEGHNITEKKERKKRLSSSNYSDNALEAEHDLKNEPKQITITPKPIPVSQETDGWDDIDVEENEEKQPQAPAKEVKDIKDPPKSVTTVKESPKSNDTSWDDFGDWGEDDGFTNIPKYEPQKPVKPIEPEPNIKEVTDRLAAASTGGGWGWGWSVDSLLSSATAGISTITSQVSQGMNTVLESTIGAPDPEELARSIAKSNEAKANKPEERTAAETNNPSTEAAPSEESKGNDAAFPFGSLISGVTKFVETTGTKVIAGGLDTLETIGKKTMEVLQDGDPGLQKKRAMLGLDQGDKPVLSQVLREAKSKAEEEDRIREEKREAKEVHYENLFDDFEGLVHLEALEMLSKQIRLRIEDQLRLADPGKRQDIKETLQQVSELCEMPDEDDEDDPPGTSDADGLLERLQTATQDLGIKLQFQPLVNQYSESLGWLASPAAGAERAVYKRSVASLAHATALSVEVYHKACEMLLVKSRRSTADEADALTQMTVVITKHISDIAAQFTEKLNSLPHDNKEQITNYITNIFLEAGNSSTYIQNAFQLALPILQIGAV